jgi:trigger factor
VAQEKIEIKDEDIDKAVENLRHQHAIWEPVDRQVNSRDQVKLDIESNVGDQPYINQKDAEFQVEKGSEFPMTGFSEELIGMKKEETKEFKLSFPADYARSELAGKEASFKVTIKEIKQEKLPEVNDELAQKVNAEFKTVDDMRAKVKETMQKQADEQSKRNFEQKIIDEVVKISEVDYPHIMEEEEIDSLIRQQMRNWQTDEKGMDQYLQSIQKTPEQFRDELKPIAVRNIKQSLVMTEVAKKEDIKIEKDDLRNEIETMTKDVPADRKDKLLELLMMPQTQANLASSIATKKTIDKLTEIVKSNPEPSAETATKSENAEAPEAEAKQ